MFASISYSQVKGSEGAILVKDNNYGEHHLCSPMLMGGALCRNIMSIDSRLNRIDLNKNIFPPNTERGYRTKFEILLEEVFQNSIE